MGVLGVIEWIIKWGLHLFLRALFLVTSPLYRMKYEGQRHKCLPAISNGLLLKSATELASMIRSRKVTALQVVEAYITRIKELHQLNAAVAHRFDEAILEAREVDRILSSSPVPDEYNVQQKPLLGVPFTAKEAFGVVGMPNCSGLLTRRDVKATVDADTVAALRGAGAIPLAVTNCSELCMWYESSNLVYGRTNNAYHQGRMVGGSSGGEGCLLSAAGSVIGIGSDVGGSIRMPAFFNGIFGHKPTPGIVSNDGQFPMGKNMVENYLCTGPMCRYANDLAPLLKVMAEPKQLPRLELDKKVDLSHLHCYYMLDDGGSFFLTPVDDQIKDTILKAAEHFRSLGASVHPVCLKELRDSVEIWACHMATSGDDSFASLMANGQDMSLAGELLRWMLCRPRHTLPAIALGILEDAPFSDDKIRTLEEKCDVLRRQFEELLGSEGFFLYPCHPQVALYHNHALTAPFNWAYTGIFNILGLPVTQVPLGMARQGVPLGLQVVGSYYQDRIPIAVAQELERVFGGWVSPSVFKE